MARLCPRASHGRSCLLTRSSYIFTSESVSEGHPDKVADRISDTVVDAFLAEEPEARVACETLVTTNRIVLAGDAAERNTAALLAVDRDDLVVGATRAARLALAITTSASRHS